MARDLAELLPAELDAKGRSALALTVAEGPAVAEMVRVLLVRARQAGRAEERAARARRRRERHTEDADYARAQVRMLAAMARRGAGDLPALRALAELRQQLAALERLAAAGLHAQGYSWAEIGRALDITRQSAWERLGCQAAPDARNPETGQGVSGDG